MGNFRRYKYAHVRKSLKVAIVCCDRGTVGRVGVVPDTWEYLFIQGYKRRHAFPVLRDIVIIVSGFIIAIFQ